MFVPSKPFQPSLVFKDKYSSLFSETVNYGRNKFYDTGPWYHKGVLTGHNIQHIDTQHNETEHNIIKMRHLA